MINTFHFIFQMYYNSCCIADVHIHIRDVQISFNLLYIIGHKLFIQKMHILFTYHVENANCDIY